MKKPLPGRVRSPARWIALVAGVLLLQACGREPVSPEVPTIAGEAAPAAAVPAPARISTAPAPATTTAVQDEAVYARYQAALGKLLPMMAVGSPRERYAALLLQPGGSGWMDHRAILQLAMADGGRDPELASAGLQACLALEEDCPKQGVLRMTAALAVDDAGIQLLRLALVPEAGREPLWQAASTASRFEDPMQSRLAKLLQATDALPRDAGMDNARTVHAFAIAAATAAPSAQLLHKRCPAAGQVSSQVLQCRQLAALMADSPTLTTALIGISIMRRQALDPQQVAEWNARYRQLQWVAQATAPWVDVTTGHAQQVARYGEVPTLLRLLRAHGLPTHPPPHWQAGMPTT